VCELLGAHLSAKMCELLLLLLRVEVGWAARASKGRMFGACIHLSLRGKASGSATHHGQP